MKKILLLSLALLCAINLKAQEHFSFRNIPINGSVKEVGAKLVELGYEPTENEGAFKGKFIGEDCTIFLLTSDYTHNVYSIVVNFNAQTRWSSLKADFNKLNEMYSDKYGAPSVSNISFARPYYDGDGYELSAIKNNKCNYVIKWDVENGSIMLTIMEDCSIVLYYSDNINEELDKQAQERSAKDEI